MDTHEYASRMENGETGTSLSSASTTICGKSSAELCSSTTATSKSSPAQRNYLCKFLTLNRRPLILIIGLDFPRWISTVCTKLKSNWHGIEQRVLHAEQNLPKMIVRKRKSKNQTLVQVYSLMTEPSIIQHPWIPESFDIPR